LGKCDIGFFQVGFYKNTFFRAKRKASGYKKSDITAFSHNIACFYLFIFRKQITS